MQRRCKRPLRRLFGLFLLFWLVSTAYLSIFAPLWISIASPALLNHVGIAHSRVLLRPGTDVGGVFLHVTAMVPCCVHGTHMRITAPPAVPVHRSRLSTSLQYVPYRTGRFHNQEVTEEPVNVPRLGGEMAFFPSVSGTIIQR
ncbi:hypothetical protein BDQ94DRAFT_133776 [Aspergillus welwitschiae]|uniref:Uncharacterized protein n=1 Tax=Aspergillus welwitschiae TaxID=1341132 RepID=A0A3F3QGG7_9EURO|nr:hypothetical protein BDQ94DRAFT_133776 [Aspergillus welwitschiae]RDH38368.1 hypothetical protein BDQ94DRAFT_133776 [Aspergillus welwitschiae]